MRPGHWPPALLAALACLALDGPARAHVGEHVAPAAGSPDPWVTAPLLLVYAGYALGLLRLWSKAGVGAGITVRQAVCFAAGGLGLALALLSPLHGLAAERFWIHMIQHELLMVVAPPLMILGQPRAAFLWLLPESWRSAVGRAMAWRLGRRLGGGLIQPVIAWALFALVLWIWHVPDFFRAALLDDRIHELQHISFLTAGLLFWWSVLHKRGGEVGRGAAILSLFGTAVHGSILGMLLTFAPAAWYEPSAGLASGNGLSALEDQQLGGLIMWIPAGLIYLAAALSLASRWLEDAAVRARRRDRGPHRVPH